MNRSLFEYHPVFGYRFIPSLRVRVPHEGGGYLVRVNASGFRCEHEFAPQKAPDTFRVLLFGDSYTAGDGVSARDRYGDVVEKLLPGVEVFNFGLPGSGTDQQYLIYRELAGGIEHDLVVIAAQVENIRRVAARFRVYEGPGGKEMVLAKPYFSLDGAGALRLHHVPVPREPLRPEDLPADEAQHVDRGGGMVLLRQVVHRLGLTELAQAVTRYQPLPAYDRADHPDWRLMRAILSRWAGEAHAPVVVMPVPIYQYVEETASAAAYQERFRELGAELGVAVHDPLPDFHRVPKSERRQFRFERDVHPTAAGHRVLAESLARGLGPFLAPAS
jgi:hypothetical protein